MNSHSERLYATPKQWLMRRVQLICITVFLVSTFFPPFVPAESFSVEDVPVEVPNVLMVEEGFIMKSSSLTEQGMRRAYAEGIVHVVKEGENIEKLASRYGIHPDTIRWANTLGAGDTLRPGDELLILPVDGVVHTVKQGQTLAGIAELYERDIEEIALQNRIDGGFILAGQELIIPNARPVVERKPTVAVVQKPPASTLPGQKPLPPAVSAPPSGGVLQLPCGNCIYTQGYRPGHYAVDLQTKGGGPIFASEDGTVVRSEHGWSGGYGNVVEIDHGNGLVTLYAHNKELYVNMGEKVRRGQVIAWMGNTGRVYGATGIHVHFEVRVHGVKKNPLLYLQ
ncbi:hypothetical protein COU77_01920 [Candidatus Peregrinibacteria bacterium CG10_big_fil_rev_8_21_14_0_10_49_16]|nr:MAG: hypothetical protein COU77_01920 [Candidatus Peregrinibacteria bacterium CG10_big_fil_rev_8_21_14_0_10_49_16]